MRWKDSRRSDNVEDRRGIPAGVAIGGGIGTLIIVLIATFLGADPRQVVNLIQNNQQAAPEPGGAPVPGDPAEEERKDFVSAVLGDTEDVWDDIFQKASTSNTSSRNSCCSVTACSQPAARPARPSGRFTARPIRRFTSTWASFRS